MNMNKRPNLKDVAARAGVSPATVSAVLNNTTGKNIRVGDATRRKILLALKETGYVANPAARVLAGAANQIIAVFTYEPVFPFEHRNFYYPFLLALEDEAERTGYDLLFITSSTGRDGRRAVYQNGANRLWLADGAILLGLQKDEEEIARLVREGFPFVIIGHRDIPGVEPSYVAADYTTATSRIVLQLIRKGHRHIALLRVPDASEPGADREAGYRAAIETAGLSLEESLVMTRSPETISTRFIENLLQSGVSAVVCERYSVAEGILALADAMDLEVPRDLSIAVLGGPHEQKQIDRNWTTLITPTQEMATAAFRMLLELVRDPSRAPLRQTLQCAVVEGSTTAEAPRGPRA